MKTCLNRGEIILGTNLALAGVYCIEANVGKSPGQSVEVRRGLCREWAPGGVEHHQVALSTHRPVGHVRVVRFRENL